MKPDNTTQPSAIIMAAIQLAETLERENAALDALDIPCATRWIDAKSRALSDVQALITDSCTARDDERDVAEYVGRRLQAEVARNKRLLERALLVQGRIIGMIARAVPRAVAANASRYAPNGGMHSADLKQPIAVSSRA
jgi:hypothetical protein